MFYFENEVHYGVYIIFGTWKTQKKCTCVCLRVSELSPSSLRVGPHRSENPGDLWGLYCYDSCF